MAITRKMVSLGRDVRIATTTGHVYRFKKGEPKNVVYAAQPFCEDKGVTFVDDTDLPNYPDLPGAAKAAPQGDERLATVQNAMLVMARRQHPGDFTGGGIPDLKALTRMVDFPIAATERNAAWAPIAQHMALGTEAMELKGPVRTPDEA